MLKLIKSLRTPFIFLLDKRYKEAKISQIMKYMTSRPYVPDFFDCDDYAWLFKSKAIERGITGVGFVIGFYKFRLHAWNVLLGDEIYQVEPQNGIAFKRNKNYIPLVVII